MLLTKHEVIIEDTQVYCNYIYCDYKEPITSVFEGEQLAEIHEETYYGDQ